MNVLVIGGGGREHAIAWKINQSRIEHNLFCLPGNPGTAAFATNIPGKVTDFALVKETVLSKAIDLVVVGPEVPLVEGITDFLAAEVPAVKVIGPSKQGAMLEGSKDFAKDFMTRHGIPTARYATFTAESYDDACAFLGGMEPPYVLKADGLAAGKGVLIVDDLQQAKALLKDIFDGKFGDAGAKVVIEQFLDGIEMSAFVLTDGKDYLLLPEAKDYKRIGDGDTGLNTGGMGSVSPVCFADEAFMEKVRSRIIEPTIAGIAKDSLDYKGFIFFGLMNCGGDPYVIEYNVRMGDPETESVMTRIKSDLLEHLIACGEGRLADEEIVISQEAAVTVIIASGGYPEEYKSHYQIMGNASKGAHVFHCGTAYEDGFIVSAGGRVLAVTANAPDIAQAREDAYDAVGNIFFTDCYYRNDIACDLLSLEGGDED
jgi:phosphoribosylamine--glycine ligase